MIQNYEKKQQEDYKMANLGKCVKCDKTCYGLEGFKVGAPGKEQVYHKNCFKCTLLF